MTTKKITFVDGRPTITLSWPDTAEGPAGSKTVAIDTDAEIPVRDDYELRMRIGGTHWVMLYGQKIVDARMAD